MQANLSTDHDLWQTERDNVLSRQRFDNAIAKRDYLAKLEAEKENKRKLDELALDNELEPQKQRLMREWLANNPSFTETDFEKKAWQHLRMNLVEQRNADILNAEIQKQGKAADIHFNQ